MNLKNSFILLLTSLTSFVSSNNICRASKSSYSSTIIAISAVVIARNMKSDSDVLFTKSADLTNIDVDTTAVFTIDKDNYVDIDISIRSRAKHYSTTNTYEFKIHDSKGSIIGSRSASYEVGANSTKNPSIRFKLKNGAGHKARQVSISHNLYWNPVNIFNIKGEGNCSIM